MTAQKFPGTWDLPVNKMTKIWHLWSLHSRNFNQLQIVNENEYFKLCCHHWLFFHSSNLELVGHYFFIRSLNKAPLSLPHASLEPGVMAGL